MDTSQKRSSSLPKKQLPILDPTAMVAAVRVKRRSSIQAAVKGEKKRSLSFSGIHSEKEKPEDTKLQGFQMPRPKRSRRTVHL